MHSLKFPFAYGAPTHHGQIRTNPEDFVVHEQLGFEPAGSGEHVFVHIEKKNTNTEWLAKQIARAAGVRPMDVGYCGLKDRHAVTRQWFSIYLPKGEFDAEPLLAGLPDVQLLSQSRHTKKLKRGTHAGNTFVITLHNIAPAVDETVSSRLERIKNGGVPNYFGEQRFGHNGNNLNLAQRWLVEGDRLGRNEKKFAMSAARSYLFNLVLAARVELGNWSALIDGEAAPSQLPTGPMWGRGRSSASGAALDIEQQAMAPVSDWLQGLEHCGLSQERRPLVLRLNHMQWQQKGETLELTFELPPGAFATAVLREIALITNAASPVTAADRA